MSPSSRSRSRFSRWLVGLALLALVTVVLAVLESSASAAPSKSGTPKIGVASLVGVPARTTAGASFEVTTTVRNKTSKAVRKQVVFRLARTADAKTTGTSVGQATTGKVRPRSTKKIKATLRLPAGLAPGQYYVSACIAARCKVAPTTILAGGTAVADRGDLTGTLTFTRTRPLRPGTSMTKNASVAVAMRYIGPPTNPDELQSVGSTYTYLSRSRSETNSGPCKTVIEEEGSGAGTLLESPNPYDDEILADMALNDLSAITMTVFMRSTGATTTTVTGDDTCDAGVTKGPTVAARTTTSMRLTQVSRTATTITYQVTSWTDQGLPASDWDTIDGTLTLQLG